MLWISETSGLSLARCCKILQQAYSATYQNAKHTWLQEPFNSDLLSTPDSWIGSRSDHFTGVNEPLRVCFGPHQDHLLSWVSMRLSPSALQRDHTCHNKSCHELKRNRVQLNRTKEQICENALSFPLVCVLKIDDDAAVTKQFCISKPWH